MLEIRDLTKIYRSKQKERFGRERAVDEVTLSVGEGEFFTLLGPSGCGKTTLLRSVGGLEVPTEGQIDVGGRTLYSSRSRVDIPANKRDLGMVFQSYAIWPHMNVFDNIAYPLTVRGRRTPKAEVRQKVRETLEIVGLSDLAARGATDLSGGQQQRLALARAIVSRPPLLLLDEPLSNLDAQLRRSMRQELIRLQEELGLTVLYVTHDQDEALAMSSLLAVMNEGKVDQLGTPSEIYERPRTRFVAGFIGSANLLLGHVLAEDDGAGAVTVETPVGPLRCRNEHGVSVGEKVQVMVRPERIELVQDGQGIRGIIRTVEYQGDAVDYEVESGGSLLRVKRGPQHVFEEGDEATMTVSDEACVLIKGEGGTN